MSNPLDIKIYRIHQRFDPEVKTTIKNLEGFDNELIANVLSTNPFILVKHWTKFY